jgi:hypothetical protein
MDAAVINARWSFATGKTPMHKTDTDVGFMHGEF